MRGEQERVDVNGPVGEVGRRKVGKGKVLVQARKWAGQEGKIKADWSWLGCGQNVGH